MVNLNSNMVNWNHNLYNLYITSPIGDINSDGTPILRAISRDSYGKNSIKGFPEFKEEDVLVKMMVDANNMKEYRC